MAMMRMIVSNGIFLHMLQRIAFRITFCNRPTCRIAVMTTHCLMSHSAQHWEIHNTA